MSDKDKAMLIVGGIFVGGFILGNISNRIDNRIKAWRTMKLAEIAARKPVEPTVESGVAAA